MAAGRAAAQAMDTMPVAITIAKYAGCSDRPRLRVALGAASIGRVRVPIDDRGSGASPTLSSRQTRLAPAAGQITDSSPPRYAFIVAVSSQSCRTTSISTNASMP